MTYWAETAPSLSTRSSGGVAVFLHAPSPALTAALFPLSSPLQLSDDGSVPQRRAGAAGSWRGAER